MRKVVEMDEETFNMSIRKFLKQVGVTSQREIEIAAREAHSAGRLEGLADIGATVRLEIPELGVDVTIDGNLKVS